MTPAEIAWKLRQRGMRVLPAKGVPRGFAEIRQVMGETGPMLLTLAIDWVLHDEVLAELEKLEAADSGSSERVGRGE